jgi:hypothetical protein
MTTYRAELIRARARGTHRFPGLRLGRFLFGVVDAKPRHHVQLYGFRQDSILVATLIMGRAVTVAPGDSSSGAIRPRLSSAARRGAAPSASTSSPPPRRSRPRSVQSPAWSASR